MKRGRHRGEDSRMKFGTQKKLLTLCWTRGIRFVRWRNEAPNSKIQDPDKHQSPNPKRQTERPRYRAGLRIGAWCLELIWSLDGTGIRRGRRRGPAWQTSAEIRTVAPRRVTSRASKNKNH